MTMQPAMLFLDFDGVLFDSVREAYVMARYAYNGTEVTEPVDEGHYQKFYSVRYMIIHAWHYRIQMEMLEREADGFDIKNFEKRFKAYIIEAHRVEDDVFERVYFQRRKRMMEEDYDQWMELSRPYPFLNYVRPLFGIDGRLEIITSKNRDAVINNLARHGITASPGNILDRDDIMKAGNKGNLLRKEMRRHGVTQAFFIDDNPDNFEGCASIEGLRCLPAGWGYTAPDCEGFTVSEIISILTTQP